MNFRHRFKCIFTIIFIQDADTGGVVYSQNVYNVCVYMMLTTILLPTTITITIA